MEEPPLNRHRSNLRTRLFRHLPWSLWGLASRLRSGTAHSLAAFRRECVGDRSYVDPSVQVAGWRNVQIGTDTTISEDCWLNVNFRDAGKKRILVGDFCHVGRRNFFSSGPQIILKDFCFTGIDCQFLGCGHDISSPLVPYIASGLSEGAPIEIGVNCWLTTAVTVLEGVRIGHGSVIGARSLVQSDIPPFSIAVGNPCRVVKRFDFQSDRWIDVSAWTQDLESLLPNELDYRRTLAAREPDIAPALFSASRRFGWI